jgi:hypothetical protein
MQCWGLRNMFYLLWWGLLWWLLLVISIPWIWCVGVHGRILRGASITIWIISLGIPIIATTTPLVLLLLRLEQKSSKGNVN